jgi:hypothetical protein
VFLHEFGQGLVALNQGERKRQGYQLFIKEGDEWKWLPDEKSVWRFDRPMPDSK